ncbi:MAG: galactokinase family protein, partial [Erysipelotrichaceae bacterium]|nr:galactokinase family protein [Erysipelotrichaceae bacterium]
MKATELKRQFEANVYNDLIQDLYEDAALVDVQNKRYASALEKFVELYGDQEVEIYSAPGRTEVGGNHTDHQHGCVLAASINLDVIAVVAKQKDVVKMVSDGFDINEIDVNDL